MIGKIDQSGLGERMDFHFSANFGTSAPLQLGPAYAASAKNDGKKRRISLGFGASTAISR
ncbi:MAG TPA: hypothetical protein VEA61_05540 [Allosphingosinicella sp.]|nr:hypothetical protein [Allosphingosinicella sp.]